MERQQNDNQYQWVQDESTGNWLYVKKYTLTQFWLTEKDIKNPKDQLKEPDYFKECFGNSALDG